MYRAFDEPNRPVIERSIFRPIEPKTQLATSPTRDSASSKPLVPSGGEFSVFLCNMFIFPLQSGSR
jgi:hypothetical protein